MICRGQTFGLRLLSEATAVRAAAPGIHAAAPRVHGAGAARARGRRVRSTRRLHAHEVATARLLAGGRKPPMTLLHTCVRATARVHAAAAVVHQAPARVHDVAVRVHDAPVRVHRAGAARAHGGRVRSTRPSGAYQAAAARLLVAAGRLQ
jgi:hypothetical protein